MLGFLGFLLLTPMILRRAFSFSARCAVRPRRNRTARSQQLQWRGTLDLFLEGPRPARLFASAICTREGDDDHESGSGSASSVRLIEEVAKNLQTIRNEAAVTQFPHLAVGEAPQLPTLCLLGVSGGSDSVALLHLIHQCIRQGVGVSRNSTRLHVVHFDHQQRGLDSTQDSEFVRRLCREHGLPFHIYSWSAEDDAAAAPRRTQQQLQSQSRPRAFSQVVAREWRRRTMRQLLNNLLHDPPTPETDDGTLQVESQQPTVGILLTAHHLDDSNESMLLKLLRGTHVTRLQGMTMVHVETTDHFTSNAARKKCATSVTWGRPLLSVRKSQLVEFLESNGLAWREDASNQSSKYLRNRVRNELIPLLTELVSQREGDGDSAVTLQNRLDRLSQQSREVQMYLDVQSDAYLQRQQQLQIVNAEPDSNSGMFYLSPFLQPQGQSSNGGIVLDLPARHALHRWLLQRRSQLSNHNMQSHSSSSYISYDHMQRIFRLLQEHPQNRTWRLDLGGGWTVIRHGEALLLEGSPPSFRSGEELLEGSPSRLGSEEHKDSQNLEIEWELGGDQVDSTLPHEYERTDDWARLTLYVPSHVVATKSFRLFSGTVASLPAALPFWPPWRGHPIAMKDFLRGQKVPLHQRTRTPLVLIQGSREDERAVEVAAVRVTSNKRRWVVSAPLAKGGTGTVPIRALVEGSFRRNT